MVDGHDLTGAPPHKYARSGIVHAPEGRSVFATLTVGANVVRSTGSVVGMTIR